MASFPCQARGSMTPSLFEYRLSALLALPQCLPVGKSSQGHRLSGSQLKSSEGRPLCDGRHCCTGSTWPASNNIKTTGIHWLVRLSVSPKFYSPFDHSPIAPLGFLPWYLKIIVVLPACQAAWCRGRQRGVGGRKCPPGCGRDWSSLPGVPCWKPQTERRS